MIHILLAFVLARSQPLGQFTKYLSPFDIFWPEDWRPSVVQLSNNHAGETVDLTLNCHIYEAVPKGAYFVMTIRGFKDLHYHFTSEFDQPLEGDNVLLFKNIELPLEAGSYGPVSLDVRYKGGNSMLLAQSSTLISIAVLDPIPDWEPKLAVSYAKGASKVISQTTTMTFSFVVNQSLYFNDYFVLDVDPNYGFDTINEGLIWDSENEDTKYFKSMKVKYDKIQKQLIFYDLGSETQNATFFNVTVTNIVNPSSVVNESKSGKWKLTIYRFGTPTVRQRVYEPGQVPFPLAGKFESAVWGFAFNTLELNPLFKDFTCYMVLNLTLGNDIPKDGIIEVVFSSVDINKYSFVTKERQTLQSGESYISSLPVNILSCVIDSSTKVTCKVLKLITNGEVVSIYNLVNFDGDSPTVESVISKDDLGYTIDTLDNPISFSYNSKSVYKKINSEDSKVFLIDSEQNEINSSGEKGDFGIAISFRTDNTLNSVKGSVFLSVSSIISTQYSTNALSFSTSVISLLSSNNNEFDYSSYVNEIETTFTQNNMVLDTNIELNGPNYVNILIKSSSNVLSLPLYPSTAGVMYEVDFYFRSLENYYFDRKILYFKTRTHENYLKPFCKIQDISGIPVQATVIPSFTWNWNLNYQVFIDFYIQNEDWEYEDWSLNGEIVGSYPSDNNFLALSGSRDSDSGSGIHLTYELKSSLLLTTNKKLSIIFPIPVLKDSSEIIFTSSIIVRQRSDNFNVTVSKSDSNTLTFSFDEKSQTDIDVTSVEDSNDLMTYTFTPKTSFTIKKFLIILQKGFDLTEITSSSYEKLDTLNKKSSFSIIYSTTSVDDSKISIGNMIKPWIGSSESSKILFVDESFNDLSCSYYDDIDILSSTDELNIILSNKLTSYTALGSKNQVQTFIFEIKSPGFFQGSSSSFLYVKLYNKIVSIEAWLDNVFYSFTENEMTFPIEKDIEKDQIMNLTITIELFEVSSQITISLIDEIYFTLNGLNVYESTTTDTSVTFIKGNPSETSKNMTVTVFPNFFNSPNVYFFITFISDDVIPAGSRITIIGEYFQDDMNLTLNLWCTLGYIDPSIDNGILSFTTLFEYKESEIITIIKDNAFTIPSNNDNKTQFKVMVSYNGFLIIDDRKRTTTFLTYNDVPTYNLYMTSLNIDISNKGGESWHTFSFKIDTKADDTWSYMFFMNKDYSAHGGFVFSYEELPKVYFLESYSSLSKISCIVDHWVIICRGLGEVNAGTVIDISIKLFNPSVDTSKWFIYTMARIDETFIFQTKPIEPITVNFTKISNNSVDILLVSYKETTNLLVDLTIRTIITTPITSSDLLKIQFPRPYTVEIYNPNQIPCSKHCRESKEIQSDFCVVQGNTVIFPTQTSISCSENQIELTIYSLYSPRSGGFIRDESSKIVTDYLEFPYWSEKFKIFIISSSSSKSYASSSYDNTNSAYTGFKESASNLMEINGNKAIKISGGTYSNLIQISFKSGILNASILKFLATDFNDFSLTFDNQGVYAVINEFSTTFFRVGIDEDQFDGFYYITWTIQETPIYTGLLKYETPSKTQVQVTSVSKVSISVTKSITMNKNSRAVIEIDFNQRSPYRNLNISLSVSSNCSVTLDKDYVIITSNSTMGYALIYSGDVEENCNISYKISGSKVFDTPSDTTVQVIKSDLNDFDVNVTVKVLGKSTVNVTISLTQPAFVYWAFVSAFLSKNETYTDIEYIKNNSQYLFGSKNEELSIARQLILYEIYLGTAVSDDWGITNTNLLRLANNIKFYGQSYIKGPKDDAILTQFFNLIADTSYTLVTYIEPLDSKEIFNYSYDFSTNHYGNSASMEIKLDNDKDDDLVQSAVALSLNIPKNRIIKYIRGQRRLLVNKNLLVLPSVRGETSTNILMKRLNEKNFLENFNSITTVNNLTSVTISTDNSGIDGSSYGSVDFSLHNFNVLDGGISFNFTLNSLGDACCIVTYDNVTKSNITDKDIALGYLFSGEIFIWKKCETVVKDRIKNITFWEKENNFENTNYYMTCMACNLYPLIPNCKINSNYIQAKFHSNNTSHSPHLKFSLLFTLLITLLV